MLSRWLGRVDTVIAEKRAALTILLSLIGVVVVALATHVIEQILGSDDRSWFPFELFAVSAATGGILLYLRDRISHRRGTLFYLRLLHPWMRDLHDVALEARLRGQAEDKVIARWIGPATHPVVDDLCDAVAGIVAETERCLNDDTSQTGSHVAPNMIWPAALAVGYDLPQLIRERMELIELLPSVRGNKPVGQSDARPRRPSRSIDWQPSRKVRTAAHRSERPRLIWLPSDQPSKAARSVALFVELTCEGRATPIDRDVDAFGRLAAFQHSSAEAAVRHQLSAEPGLGACGRRRVLIDRPSRPVEIDLNARRGTKRARADHAQKWQGADPPVDGAGIKLLTVDDFREELLNLDPRLAAQACWQGIREALHRHPNAYLLLNLRVPKTVVLMVGSMLAVAGQDRNNPGCREFWSTGQKACWQDSCLHPWGRIVPLMYDEDTRTYRIARVHPFQPSVNDLSWRI